MCSRYSRGSEWRKWDLHVHTRIDKHYKCLGIELLKADQLRLLCDSTGLSEAQVTSQEKEISPSDYARLFISYVSLLTDISVIGITDHNSGELLDAILEASSETHSGLVVLPGVEVSSSHGIHILCLFDPQRKWRETWRETISHFLTEIEIKPTPFDGDGNPAQSNLTTQHVLGKVDDHNGLCIFPHIGNQNGLFHGSLTAQRGQTHIDIYRDRLCRMVELPDKGKLAAGIQNIIHGRDPNYGSKAVAQVKGSDARRLTEVGTQFTWIKADPTLAGLRQASIESQSRTFIRTEPSQLTQVRSNKTKYISSIGIHKTDDADLAEDWFDFDLALNCGFVSIIGNRGSGKSALSETIGLLGNSYNEDYYSFLCSEKFRHSRANKAKHFVATLVWEDGEEVVKSLSERHNPNRSERVKYIPQNYLEQVCNELRLTDGDTNFDRELKSVIFSHVEEHERLGADSLDKLISLKCDQIEQLLYQLEAEMHGLNVDIVKCKSKLKAEYRETIEDQLQGLRRRLESLEGEKPAPVTKPDEDQELQAEAQQIALDIAKKQETLQKLGVKIETAREERKQATLNLEAVRSISKALDNLKRLVDIAQEKMRQDLKRLDLDLSSVVSFEINKKPAADKESSIQEELDRIDETLSETNENSLVHQKTVLAEAIEELSKGLEGPAKEYQEYEKAVADWEKRKELIVGDVDTPDTVAYLERQLENIPSVRSELRDLESDRTSLFKEIVQAKLGLADTYKALYRPVHEFVEQEAEISKELELSFEVSMRLEGFVDRFFELVSHSAAGTFYSIEDGRAFLEDMIRRFDLECEDGALQMVEQLMVALSRDLRQPESRATNPEKQLRKGKTLVDLYDYIYSLGFLRPHYALRLRGKDLVNLSPGERGTLLLVFYLLVDKGDVPLVIDQPEENLDNQTVFRLLGKCISRARTRRQVILVTHNPNLAVACDAEQVVCAYHYTSVGESVSYFSGSIEDPITNASLVDILEGTRPAFLNRELKYLASD